jgi:hypothetical protein
MKFTRKLLSTTLLVVLIFSTVTSATVFTNEINVTIDGQAVDFPGGQGAALVDGRTLVPVRGVFEMLGFEVDWDNDTRTAILTNAEHEVRITIDSNVFTTNGIRHTLDVPAQLIGGRTMVPIRLPLESVGVSVDWNNETRTVLISNESASRPTTSNPVPTPTPQPSSPIILHDEWEPWEVGISIPAGRYVITTVDRNGIGHIGVYNSNFQPVIENTSIHGVDSPLVAIGMRESSFTVTLIDGFLILIVGDSLMFTPVP